MTVDGYWQIHALEYTQQSAVVAGAHLSGCRLLRHSAAALRPGVPRASCARPAQKRRASGRPQSISASGRWRGTARRPWGTGQTLPGRPPAQARPRRCALRGMLPIATAGTPRLHQREGKATGRVCIAGMHGTTGFPPRRVHRSAISPASAVGTPVMAVNQPASLQARQATVVQSSTMLPVSSCSTK